VKKSAILVDIKRVYRKLVLLYHPDKNVNKPIKEQQEAEHKFKQIQEAYDYIIVNHKEPKPKKKRTSTKKKNPPQTKKPCQSKTQTKKQTKTQTIIKEELKELLKKNIVKIDEKKLK
ncbi:15119_t:CDS:1, partial [Racocetra persica]